MTSKASDLRHRQILLNYSCLAIVLHHEIASSSDTSRFGNSAPHSEDFDFLLDSYAMGGMPAFLDFVNQNSMCYWNQCLVKSVVSLEYRGCLMPSTLLVAGTEFALEVIRSAWARRVLRPPKGYAISNLGDISTLEMRPVPQTQFAPLSEALCKVILELNDEGVAATSYAVAAKLEKSFPEMQVPSEDILYRTLGALIKERKLYHTGLGYFVVGPDTYRQRAISPLCERQMLMTNEEAIVRLHGDQKERSLAIQVDESDIAAAWQFTSSSLASSSVKQNISSSSSQANREVSSSPDLKAVRLNHCLRTKNAGRHTIAGDMLTRRSPLKDTTFKKNDTFSNELNDVNMNETQKCEKQSMLAKFLRRMHSLTETKANNKHVTFSAQFPPLEWLQPGFIHCHSVATQTSTPSVVTLRKIHSKPFDRNSFHLDPVQVKIPWEESENKIPSSFTSTPVSKRWTANSLETHNTRKKTNSPRQGISKNSSPYRYAHAAASSHTRKSHHRHRKSSAEIPKSDNVSKNGSFENKIYSDSKFKSDGIRAPLNSSMGPLKTSSPKAIILPCVSKDITSSPSSAISNNISEIAPPITKTYTNVIREPNSLLKLSGNSTKDKVLPFSLDSKISEIPKSSILVAQANSMRKDNSDTLKNLNSSRTEESEQFSNSESSSDAGLSLSESSSGKSRSSIKPSDQGKIEKPINIAKSNKTSNIVDETPVRISPPSNEVIIDNSVNVEVAVEKLPIKKMAQTDGSKANNVSTTVSQTVTEETTVTKGGKVITVTSVTTSLSQGALKDLEKTSPVKNNVSKSLDSAKEKNTVNDLNLESKKSSRVIDCSSTCNIVTEVK